MDLFGDNLYNLYGSTEVAWATIATPEDLRDAPGTAGRPPRGTVVKLFDDDGKPVEQGETGRIFVGNELQFEGYTGGGGKDDIDGLMSSGDVGHFDEAGRLFVDGRDDDMIVSGGENVFPPEVEDLLAGHDAIARGGGLRRRRRGVRPAAEGGRRHARARARARTRSRRTSRRTSPATRSRATSSSSTSCRATSTGKVLKRELKRRLRPARYNWRHAPAHRHLRPRPARAHAPARAAGSSSTPRSTPFDFGGQRYAVEPALIPVRLDVSRTTGNGWALRLRFEVDARGPVHALPRARRARRSRRRARGRTSPGGGEELQLALRRRRRRARPRGVGARRARARAAGADHLRPDCAGLCPRCGANLNEEPDHAHEAEPDPRWAKLSEIRFD